MREIPENVRADAVLLVESYLWGTPTERNSAIDEIISRAGKDGSVLLMAMWERLEKIGHQWDGDIEILLLRVADRAAYRGSEDTIDGIGEMYADECGRMH